MNRKTLFVSLAMATILIAAAFWAGSVYASTGCFTDTNGHWAETFICWMKDNGISSGYPDGTYRPENYITRAEVAALLSKQVQIPPSAGLTYINVGPSDWYLNSGYGSTQILYRYSTSAMFGYSATGGPSELDATPAFPAALYGRNMALRKMVLCYTADSARGYLDKVELRVYTMSTSGGTASPLADLIDDTDRFDSACREYVLTASQVLDERSRIAIRIFAYNDLAAGSVVTVGRTTLILEPTTQSTGLTP